MTTTRPPHAELLRRINSATKYPSIPTYHRLDGDGRLLPELTFELNGPVIITEKIDGTNARIILPPRTFSAHSLTRWIIGSRTELLASYDDLIANPELSIVDTLVPRVRLVGNDSDNWVVVYGEVYGGKETPSWKEYSDGYTTAFRVFDIAVIDHEVLTWPAQKIAHWRDNGGQYFPEWTRFGENPFPGLTGLDAFEWVPAIKNPIGAHWLPKDIAGMYDYVRAITDLVTQAAIPGKDPGRCEGVVIRTPDRFRIVKAKLRDYERALRPAQSPRERKAERLAPVQQATT